MPKSSTTDATKLLAEGHRKVEELFEKFEKHFVVGEKRSANITQAFWPAQR